MIIVLQSYCERGKGPYYAARPVPDQCKSQKKFFFGKELRKCCVIPFLQEESFFLVPHAGMMEGAGGAQSLLIIP